MIKLKSLLVEVIVYHGTNKSSADNIRKVGFVTGEKPDGMSTSPNGSFVFVTPHKTSAKWYSNTIRTNPDEQVVLKCELSGKILDLKMNVPDYRAFGYVADMLEAKPKTETIYDLEKIKDAMERNGYSAFSFKDSNAGGRVAIAANPKFLRLV